MTGVNNDIFIDTNNETEKIIDNKIMNQFDMHNLFDMNSTRTKKRYDQMQKRKAFLNNINNVNNVDNISENDIVHIDINQLEKTSHTTPLPPDEFIKQPNNNLKKELNENVQIQSEINLNKNNENAELNISNLDNSVEIHEDAEDISNSNVSDIKQIISKYHAKSKSFIQLNNNLVARAAIDNNKNTQSYMMALYPELFRNNNNNNRISVNNYEVEDIIKEENENENNTYNSNNNNNNQLNATMPIDNDNNNSNKKKHQRTSSAVIQKEPAMMNVKNNNKNRNNYSHLDNYSYLYKLKTNNTKKKTKQNYLNYSLNIYRNKDTSNSNISLFISNKKKTVLKNQKSNSTKIIFGKSTKLESIDKISSKPLNNSITTFPNKKDDSNKYSNNNNIIKSYCSKEQIFTNLKKKYQNYNFTFTSPNYKNSTMYCISPTSNPKLHAKLNNTNKIKVKLNLSQKINSIPFISSISSTNIKINSLNQTTNSSVSKKLITFALQRINYRPLSTYSYALNALNKSHKEMFCILVCNDNKNGDFLFRGLYEIIKNEHGEYVNAVKLFSYSYCSCKIVFKQIKHFYTIKTNKTIYEFCKYKPELKEFNEKVVLMM
jgi:hypothetical protein